MNLLMTGPLLNGAFKPVQVTSIRRNKIPCQTIRASQSASIGLDSEVEGLRKGMVLVSPKSCPKACIYFQVYPFNKNEKIRMYKFYR